MQCTSLKAGCALTDKLLLGCFPPTFIFGIDSNDDANFINAIEVYELDGSTFVKETIGTNWLLCLKPARDVTEQNVEITIVNGQLRAHTIRSVTRGETLLGWYAMGSAMTLGILPISMSNIHVDGFVCTNCQKIFKYPNPLKSHCRFRCAGDSWNTINSAAFQPESYIVPPLGTIQTQMPSSILMAAFLSTQHALHTHQILQDLTQSPSKSELQKNISPLTMESTLDEAEKVEEFSDESPTKETATISEISPRSNNSSLDSDETDADDDPSESVKNEQEPINMIPRVFYSPLPGSDKYLCIYCGKLYSRKYGLKIHLRTHTGYKPLKCRHCHRPFGDPSNLNKHMRLHTQSGGAASANSYQCDDCGKILVRRRDLQRHKQSRHQIVD